ncbi:MAG: SDR family NAD(P)-dependent oxidoreductase [Rhodopirellula sp.]|nr:SDR family NAD(P)-dependent oxidoreductase [Rhodopirellula sp.]
MDHYIRDKIIVITGGSSGFGLEAARMVLEMGAKVAITGRDADRLRRAEESLRHDDLLALRADATRTDDWKRLIGAVLERFGRIDVLVNNHGAGIKITEVENMEDDDIHTVLDVNLASVIKGCREAVRVMKTQASGHIVNVSSGCAYHSWPSWAVYTAAKDGMIGFTRCLHVEMAKWGGKATTFVPGAARTGFCQAAGIADDWMEGFPDARDFARSLVHAIDVPEHCFVEEVNVWGTKQVIVPF